MGSALLKLAFASVLCGSALAQLGGLGGSTSGLIGSSAISNPTGAASSVTSGGNVSVLSLGNNPTGGASLINIGKDANLTGGLSLVNIGTDQNGLHVGLLDVGKAPNAGGVTNGVTGLLGSGGSSGSAGASSAAPVYNATGNNGWFSIKQNAYNYEASIPNIKYSSSLSGADVILQDAGATALREGPRTTIRALNTQGYEWVHFSFPTPDVYNGDRLALGAVSIRFTSGKSARIVNWWTWDGDQTIGTTGNLNLTGDTQVVTLRMENQRTVNWGVLISLGVSFDPSGQDSWIQFISAKADFVAAK